MNPTKKTHEDLEAVEITAIEKANNGISNVSILIVSVFSLILNVVCIYLLLGNTFNIPSINDPIGIKRALLEMEYQKVGGKDNYDLLAKAQLIQFNQTLPQLKEFVAADGGETGNTPEVAPQDTVLDAEAMDTIRENAAIEGKKDAAITVIEYSDMECPFCIKQYHDTKLREKLLAEYGDRVNFVFKNNRGVNHPGTEPKAIASLCAQKVGGDEAYIKYYNAIMVGTPDSRTIYPVADLPKLARELKLDMNKWQKCYDDKETKDVFIAQTNEANTFKLGGTPGTLILNNTTGKYSTVEGAYPYASFTAKIDELLK